MRIDPSSNIGGVLRQARIDAGISQGDLARMLDIPASTLSRVERGTLWFDTDWVLRMPAPLRVVVREALDLRETVRVFQRGDDSQTRSA